MKKSAIFLLGAALLNAPLVVAYDDDEEEVEEVVVTAPRVPSGSMPTLPPPTYPFMAASPAELYAFQEAGRRSAEAVADACEAAKQDAVANGAVIGAGAAVGYHCPKLPTGAAKAACLIAVATAVAACTFTPSGGSSN